MKRSQPILSRRPIALMAVICAALAGCGGAGGQEEQATQVSTDAAAYAATQDYCGSKEPTGAAAEPGGWEITSPSHFGNPTYDVNAIVSPGGTTSSAFPVRLQVNVEDYRGVTGSFVGSGYGEPEWKMGISFSPVLPARSAACVAGLAKLTPPAPSPFGLPGATTPVGYTLAWSSKWSARVPVDRVPGAVLDGFEFVSTFAPASAQVFFVVSKKRLPVAQGVSICYLAPAATNWDCAPASAADQGKDWGFSRRAAQPGVYVLAAPPAA